MVSDIVRHWIRESMRDFDPYFTTYQVNIKFILAYHRKIFQLHPDDPIRSDEFFLQLELEQGRYIDA